jgi:ATP-dependent Clp protease ATP-binding subunit ClpA
LTPEARELLAKIGYDPSFGARPLKRALQKHVESPLSISLLSGEFSTGDTVIIGADQEKQDINFKKK